MTPPTCWPKPCRALWPGTQVTIGPVIENGFYYDFFRNQPFTPEDFAAIEKKMREIIARDKPFTKEMWSRDEAKRVFRDKGELFKVELVDAIPADQQIKIYKQGDWFDLCRGPHMTSTGKVGGAFKLMKVAGAYWRGRFQPRHAHPHLRHCFRQAGGARRLSQADRGGREARPPQARSRDGFVPFPGGGAGLGVLAPQGLDAVPDSRELHPTPTERRRLRRGQLAAAHGLLALGRLRSHGDLSRHDVPDAASRRRRAHIRHQADELPGPHPDFQEWAEVLSRPAAQDCRIRQGTSLRAFGRAARADARARLHPGRCPRLHYRSADRGRSRWQ